MEAHSPPISGRPAPEEAEQVPASLGSNNVQLCDADYQSAIFYIQLLLGINVVAFFFFF